MHKKFSSVAYFIAFLKEFSTIFTLTIIVFTFIAKMFSANNFNILEHSSILALGGIGLPFATILQISGFSLIMSVLSKLIFSEYSTFKIRFLLRHFLFFVTTFFISSVFSLIFKWFPTGKLLAWLAFFVFFFVFFCIAIGISILLMKFEDKKYNKLLENYKQKQKK